MPVEIRPNDDGSIDEIIAKGCDVHIEQMSDDTWYVGIDMPGGESYIFYVGAKNGRSHVAATLAEVISGPTTAVDGVLVSYSKEAEFRVIKSD